MGQTRVASYWRPGTWLPQAAAAPTAIRPTGGAAAASAWIGIPAAGLEVLQPQHRHSGNPAAPHAMSAWLRRHRLPSSVPDAWRSPGTRWPRSAHSRARASISCMRARRPTPRWSHGPRGRRARLPATRVPLPLPAKALAWRSPGPTGEGRGPTRDSNPSRRYRALAQWRDITLLPARPLRRACICAATGQQRRIGRPERCWPNAPDHTQVSGDQALGAGQPRERWVGRRDRQPDGNDHVSGGLKAAPAAAHLGR